MGFGYPIRPYTNKKTLFLLAFSNLKYFSRQHNEEPKAEIVDDPPNSNHVNATEKKDAQQPSSIHPKGT